MRECRCSWQHLCVASLERCWEKGENAKGAVGAGEREAAGQGFPDCANVSCSLENSFLCLSVCLSVSLPPFLQEQRFLLLLRRYILKFFWIFNIQICPLRWHSWLFCVSHWSPKIAIQCVFIGECFKTMKLRKHFSVPETQETWIWERSFQGRGKTWFDSK